MKASKDINKVSLLYILKTSQYFNYEFYLSFILTILGLLDNNIIFLLISLSGLIYNIYSKIQKIYILNMLIDDRKKNLNEANRVSLLYKFKFILYTLLTMIAVSFFVLNCFGPFDFMKKIEII